MWRSFILKASLLIMMVSLCVVVPIVNAEGGALNWTSPTTATLYSVHMVSADDGWVVGMSGTIIRWTGTEWIPEFPTAILTPLLISLTLVAVILAKTASKKTHKTNHTKQNPAIALSPTSPLFSNLQSFS